MVAKSLSTMTQLPCWATTDAARATRATSNTERIIVGDDGRGDGGEEMGRAEESEEEQEESSGRWEKTHNAM
jgi:hypothetical protein